MKRVIFIGQAMPRSKKDPHDWVSLKQWLYTIDLTEAAIKKFTLFSALVDYFPGAVKGSHIIPSSEEIEAERPRLKKTLVQFSPDIVVPIGRLSIAYCLQQTVQPLTETIGKIYTANPYGLYKKELPIIPLPHPSGASTWKYQAKNMKLLHEALHLLNMEFITP